MSPPERVREPREITDGPRAVTAPSGMPQDLGDLRSVARDRFLDLAAEEREDRSGRVDDERWVEMASLALWIAHPGEEQPDVVAEVLEEHRLVLMPDGRVEP